MPGKSLSLKEKTLAVAWLTAGESCKKVAERLERSVDSVERIKAKMKTLPPLTIPKRKSNPGSGKVRRLSLASLVKMKRAVQRSPTLTARKLKVLYPQDLGHISVRVIQRRLKLDCNLPSRRAAKKPLLTQAMRDKRWNFARAHLHWTPDDWRKVMFTDESTFR